jgi:hypothetical protein
MGPIFPCSEIYIAWNFLKKFLHSMEIFGRPAGLDRYGDSVHDGGRAAHMRE